MKSAFLVMTSLWLSGSVSAAETLPVVQVGHHTKGQAPDAKGGDAKGQDAKGGKAENAWRDGFNYLASGTGTTRPFCQH